MLIHPLVNVQPPHNTQLCCAGVPLRKMEEKSYFFRMSEYKDRLVEHIQAHPEFILPESRRNSILCK